MNVVTRTTYVLVDQGDAFVHLEGIHQDVPVEARVANVDHLRDAFIPEELGDWRPMRAFHSSSGMSERWYVTALAEHEAISALRTTHPQPPKLIGWALPDDVELGDAYPRWLNRDEFNEKFPVDDEELERPDPVHKLYEPRTTDVEPKRVEHPVGVRLNGAPPPVDGLTWVAELPHFLREQAGYRHLFPGALVGFREAVRVALTGASGYHAASARGPVTVQDVYLERSSSRTVNPHVLEVRRSIPWNPPRTTTAKRPGRRRETVPIMASVSLEVAAPDRIPGPTRAAAKVAWENRLDAIRRAVEDLAVEACAACNATGYRATHEVAAEEHEYALATDPDYAAEHAYRAAGGRDPQGPPA